MAGNPFPYQAGHQCSDLRTWPKIWVKLSKPLSGEIWWEPSHRIQKTVKAKRPGRSIALSLEAAYEGKREIWSIPLLKGRCLKQKALRGS